MANSQKEKMSKYLPFWLQSFTTSAFLKRFHFSWVLIFKRHSLAAFLFGWSIVYFYKFIHTFFLRLQIHGYFFLFLLSLRFLSRFYYSCFFISFFFDIYFISKFLTVFLRPFWIWRVFISPLCFIFTLLLFPFEVYFLALQFTFNYSSIPVPF